MPDEANATDDKSVPSMKKNKCVVSLTLITKNDILYKLNRLHFRLKLISTILKKR